MKEGNHKVFMQRCIQLALNGLGKTYPNPLVGSVIVYKGKIIGEGWHQKAGEPHAEVNAISAVQDESLLSESTIYVNLEPCSHWGRTPPCSDLIVKKKIKNVVIGTIDYNSRVFGKGIEHMKKHGCHVEVGVLEKECVNLNKRFFTFHKKKRPYIILKWAETRDGFIAPKMAGRKDIEAKPVWISNPYSLQLVHKMRSEEQSILVGTRTAVNDNPKLDVRSYYGKDPIRLLIDKDLKVNNDFNLFDRKIKTVIFNKIKSADKEDNIVYKKLYFDKSIPEQVLDYLYEQEIQSVIVEGGAQTLKYFIEKDLWDEARIFYGDLSLKKGIKAPELKGKLAKHSRIMNNELRIYIND